MVRMLQYPTQDYTLHRLHLEGSLQQVSDMQKGKSMCTGRLSIVFGCVCLWLLLFWFVVSVFWAPPTVFWHTFSLFCFTGGSMVISGVSLAGSKRSPRFVPVMLG